MTIFEHIKKQHANIKDRPKEERWQYFLDYYKWHALAVLLAIVLLIQGVVSIVNRKEVVFSGILLNCVISIDDEAFLQGFYDHTDINGKKQQAAFYTDIVLTDKNNKNDINAFQRIMAGIATKDTDFIVGQSDNFRLCAYNSSKIFMDLRTFLDEDALNKLSDRLYYIDGAVVEKLAVPVGELQDANITYPDPTKPETMEDPIPVGINISDRTDFQEAYYFPNTTLYLGVIANTPRPELTKQFIAYLFP
jgi:hypothetical protein